MIYQQRTVRVTDMAREARWPAFAAGAAAAGAGSMLSMLLYVDGDNLGSLNHLATRAGAFGDESEHVGLLFAAYAAMAYDFARIRARLTRAVDTRQLIGQAQGILMERLHLSGPKAFAVLVRTSQQRNLRLQDLADHLVNPSRSGPDGAEPDRMGG